MLRTSMKTLLSLSVKEKRVKMKGKSGFVDQQQSLEKSRGIHNKTSQRSTNSILVFVGRIFSYLFDNACITNHIIHALGSTILKSSHEVPGDPLTQRGMTELDNVLLQKVKNLLPSIEQVIDQPQRCQEQVPTLTTDFAQHYINNALAGETLQPHYLRICLQKYAKLEHLTQYVLTFCAICDSLHSFITNNISKAICISNGSISSLHHKTQASKTYEEPTDGPKVARAPAAFANSTAAQTTGRFGSLRTKNEKRTGDSAAPPWRSPSRFREEENAAKTGVAPAESLAASKESPKRASCTTVIGEQAGTVKPSAQVEQLEPTVPVPGRSHVITGDAPIDLRHENSKRHEKDVVATMPNSGSVPLGDEERAAESIQSGGDIATESHGSTDTPRSSDDEQETPLPLTAGASDTVGEEDSSRKAGESPDSEEDPDAFRTVSGDHPRSVHIPSKLFMVTFAKSTPEDGGLEGPDVSEESATLSNDKRSARMPGDQESYVSLHTFKLCATESIDGTRGDQNQCQPVQTSPTDPTELSGDVYDGDEDTAISSHNRPAASSDLDLTQDKGMLRAITFFEIMIPSSTINVHPVVPRSTEEGLARVDFRSPDRERMNVEGFRVGTFLFYTQAENHAVLRLANAGFYHTGRGDTLACFCCDATFSYADRRQGEEPYDIHRELNPNCPHLMGRDTGNVFIQDEQTRAESGGHITGFFSQSANAAQLVLKARQNLHQASSRFLNSTLSSDTNFQNQNGSIAEDPYNTQGPDQSKRYENNINGTNMTSSAAVTSHIFNENDIIGHISNTYQRRQIIWQEPRPEPADRATSSQVPSRTAANTERPPAGYAPGDPSAPAGSQASAASSDTAYRPALAVHPRYMNQSQREASFAQWPDTHAQSPRELAVAGFFFTGVGDSVRCHYCGLGLKHWDPDDRPLDEHVRWRSSCGYLLALCGDDFIATTLGRLGSRQRQDEISSGSDVAQSVMAVMRGRSIGTGSTLNGPHPSVGTNRVVDIDVQMTSEAAQSARDMGFPDDVIRTAITELLGLSAGTRAVTTQTLVHAIIYVQQRGQDFDGRVPSANDDYNSENSDESGDDNRGHGSSDGSRSGVITAQGLQTIPREGNMLLPPPGVVEVRRASETATEGSESRIATSTRSADETSVANQTPRPRGLPRRSLQADPISQQTLRELEQENQELRERRRCKICLDNDVSILFLPCGHLVCCAECAPALRRCPMCRKRITGTVRIQLSALPPDNNTR